MYYLLKSNDTAYLRTFAILVIINSHLDVIYGNSLYASGGAIGNTLFFLLSGYGLKYSIEKNKIKYIGWIRKRLKGIYPAIWVFNFFLAFYSVFSTVNFEGWGSFLISFIYTKYWFINAIILFFIFGYPFLRITSVKKLIKWLLALFFIYLLVYSLLFNISDSYIIEQLPYKIAFYFLTFLSGILVFHFKERLNGKKYFVLLVTLSFLILYLFIKIFLRDSILFRELQIFQQIIQLIIAYGIIQINFAFNLYSRLNKFKFIKDINSIISNITLEIYIVHGFIIHVLINLNSSIIVKLFLIYSLSICFALLLKVISHRLTNKI
jgi:peptidoglycan/LPS O-acetylase OafA/YrhL